MPGSALGSRLGRPGGASRPSGASRPGRENWPSGASGADAPVRPGGSKLYAASQPGPLRRDSPLGATRILIDGRNVQRALERGATPGSLPTSLLIARLRAAFAPPTEVELILDGHAGPTPTGRIAAGFSVVFGRGVSADHVIAERVVEAFRALGPVEADTVMVVSDDREVRAQALRNGIRVQGTAWLAGHLAARARIGARAGATIGHGRAPRTPRDRDLG
ncbi:MAG TPA: hypothetical protein VGM49_03935 [Candidatus Limnocylindrales bacterium]